jgi:dethiobiotin synthetase
MDPEDVAPLRFAAAAAPHLAAALEGRGVDPRELLDGAARAQRKAGAGEVLVVEGVGGLLAPLAEDFSVRDLARAFALPLLVAARPGLGTISHTLLTLEAARVAGLEVRGVVLTPWPRFPTALERSNRETIERLGAVEVTGLARVQRPDPRALARAGETLPWRRWVAAPASCSPPALPRPVARSRASSCTPARAH